MVTPCRQPPPSTVQARSDPPPQLHQAAETVAANWGKARHQRQVFRKAEGKQGEEELIVVIPIFSAIIPPLVSRRRIHSTRTAEISAPRLAHHAAGTCGPALPSFSGTCRVYAALQALAPVAFCHLVDRGPQVSSAAGGRSCFVPCPPVPLPLASAPFHRSRRQGTELPCARRAQISPAGVSGQSLDSASVHGLKWCPASRRPHIFSQPRHPCRI